MFQLIKKRLINFSRTDNGFELIKIFELLFNTQCLTSALLNGTGAAATVSLGGAITAMVAGTLVSKASGATIALNGPTLLNTGAIAQVWIFTIDQLGNLYAYPGVPAATIGAVQLPYISETTGPGATVPNTPQAVIGSLIMVNASVGSFIPATTLLNVANLGIVVNNTVGPFYPVGTL